MAYAIVNSIIPKVRHMGLFNNKSKLCLLLLLTFGCNSVAFAIDTGKKQAPANAVKHIEQGDELLGKELTDKAIASYRKAIQLAPDDSRAYQRLGNAMAQAGKLDAAIEEERRAIQLNPTNALAHADLGWLLGMQKSYRAAIAEEKIAISLDPRMISAYMTLGLALASLGEYPQAIAAFERVIQLDPNNMTAYVNLAGVMGRKGDYAGSINIYRKAISLNKSYLPACLGLAAALGKIGDISGEITELKNAIALAPSNASAHGKLGWALSRKGDWRGSIREGMVANMLRVKSSWSQFVSALVTVWAGIFIVFGLIFLVLFSGSGFKPQMGEEVIKSFFLTFYKDKPGRFVITSRRLVFVPEAFSQWFGATRISIERDQIENIKRDSTGRGGNITVASRSGSVHQFTMPHLVLEPLMAELNKLKIASTEQ